MRVSVQIRKPVDARADVLVLGRHSDEARPGPELAAVDARLGGLLSRVLEAESVRGQARSGLLLLQQRQAARRA